MPSSWADDRYGVSDCNQQERKGEIGECEKRGFNMQNTLRCSRFVSLVLIVITLTSPIERVHDSIKPSVWSRASSLNHLNPVWLVCYGPRLR